MRESDWIRSWARDFLEVGVTVAVIIIVLKVTLGAEMLVPLVVVTSGSMTHNPGDTAWIDWLNFRNVTGETIDSFPLLNGFKRGDMIIVKSPESELGDVIIYERDLHHRDFMGNDPIIHRTVGVIHVSDWTYARHDGTLDCITMADIDEAIESVKSCQSGGECRYPMYPSSGSFKLYVTKGDNNQGSDQCSNRLRIAYLVNEAQITGRGFIRIPYIGYVKLLMNLILSPIIFVIRSLF
ncbi:MAG: hypothetical protein ABIH11_04270 [Candidatus Altiarchaeota archaeon]